MLWPAARKHRPDGEQLTLQVEEEHQEINQLFSRLEATALEDPARRALIDRIVELLRQDVRDEEDDLLPRLQDKVTDDELRRLGSRWELVRRTAPTRPHPVVARRPPGNVLAALPLSLIDRTRDLLDHAARHPRVPAGTALSMASRGLAHASRRVERVGMMRSGERAQTSFDD